MLLCNITCANSFYALGCCGFSRLLYNTKKEEKKLDAAKASFSMFHLICSFIRFSKTML